MTIEGTNRTCVVQPLAARSIEVVAREYVVETRACWPGARERAFATAAEAVVRDIARLIHARIEPPRTVRKQAGNLLLHADVSIRPGNVTIAVFFFGEGAVELPVGPALHDGFVSVARYATWSRGSACVLRRWPLEDERLLGAGAA